MEKIKMTREDIMNEFCIFFDKKVKKEQIIYGPGMYNIILQDWLIKKIIKLDRQIVKEI